MELETRAIASLTPHPENYQRHPQAQIETLRRVLRLHGLQKPVVIQPDGTILAGHGIVEAAKAEGWDSIACHVYDGPNPRAFLIADNRTAQLAEPDLESLLATLRLEDAAGALAATAYDDAALSALIAGLEPTPPPVKEWDETAAAREAETWVDLKYRLPASAAVVVEREVARIMELCAYKEPGLALERMAILSATVTDEEIKGE